MFRREFLRMISSGFAAFGFHKLFEPKPDFQKSGDWTDFLKVPVKATRDREFLSLQLPESTSDFWRSPELIKHQARCRIELSDLKGVEFVYFYIPGFGGTMRGIRKSTSRASGTRTCGTFAYWVPEGKELPTPSTFEAAEAVTVQTIDWVSRCLKKKRNLRCNAADS